MTLAAWTLDSLTFGAVFALTAVCAALGLWRWGTNWTASGRDLTRAQRAETRETRETRRQLEALLVRLEEFSRDVDARVDAACARLQKLLDETDRRAAPPTPAPSASLPPARLERGEFGARLDRIRRRLRAVPSAAETAPIVASRVVEVPAAAAAISPLPASVAHHDPRFEHVYTAADRGLSSSAIAAESGLPVGEVDLILNLRRPS